MRPNDRAMISRVWPKWISRIGHVHDIILHAPDVDEFVMFRGMGTIRVTQIEDWNIDKQRCPYPSDVIVMSNVFMYSSDPHAWFENVLSSCKHLFLLDHIRSQRGADVELGSDGDAMRFSHTGKNEFARMQGAFDLLGFDVEGRMLDFVPYDAPREGDRTFMALLRGDLR